MASSDAERAAVGAAARRVRPWLRACVLACVVAATASCGVPKQMLVSPGELADYRAFRTAAYEGARLAFAHDYLERHPQGAWASDVHEAFETEEPGWFEAAKTSRWRARAYLIDMPWGPHAEAARALLALFDGHQEDVETLELLAAARLTEAMLDAEAATRKRVEELVLEELAALLDKATWGARLDDSPPALAGVLRGPARGTWGWGGAALRPVRDDQVFFVVPTPEGPQARVADVHLQLQLERGRVVQGLIRGSDLFVRWAEATQVRVLDPAEGSDRVAAASEVRDVLKGALEAALPAARCAVKPIGKGGILTRACDGWLVSARMGNRAGEVDVVEVRGPWR